MSGDLPTSSGNSAPATKIFAKAVLLKTISSEKWSTYSKNTVERGPKKSLKNYAQCTLLLRQVPFYLLSSFKHTEGLVWSCTWEHDISNCHLRYCSLRCFTFIPKQTCAQSEVGSDLTQIKYGHISTAHSVCYSNYILIISMDSFLDGGEKQVE